VRKIFVSGASGNVGRLVVKNVIERDGFSLAGGYCRECGEDLGSLAGLAPIGLKACETLREGLEKSGADLVIDFTNAAVLMAHLKVYAELGLDAVIGTTGLSDADFGQVEALVTEKGLRWAVISNYGLGINLVMDFLSRARQFYPYVTITDRHHPAMANAPSGTAAMLARSASDGPEGPVDSREVYEGVLGGRIAGIPVHSERLPYPGPFSEHEIVLGRQDEIIRITVSDFSSEIYMDGVFLAAEKVPGLKPGSLVRKLSDLG
jgi:4-hydroxy-tetrahydrodipicolinate reductase